jgi:hypothetical protein
MAARMTVVWTAGETRSLWLRVLAVRDGVCGYAYTLRKYLTGNR